MSNGLWILRVFGDNGVNLNYQSKDFNDGTWSRRYHESHQSEYSTSSWSVKSLWYQAIKLENSKLWKCKSLSDHLHLILEWSI